MDHKVQHTVRLNAPFCGFARQPACLRRRPPGGPMADDVRSSALGRVRGDPDIASAMIYDMAPNKFFFGPRAYFKISSVLGPDRGPHLGSANSPLI